MTASGGAFLALMLLLSRDAGAEQPNPEASAGPAGIVNPGEPEIVRVRGRVRLVGSEPFPEIYISDENGVDWHLERREGRALLPYQQRIITVEGQADTLELILANGETAGVRRILRNIRIQAEPAE
ncbi:MAG: hypothetical protein LBD65_07050 [Spirochaetaceae bacterium]|jgi:hypothetical protein|nr:hypothetical protein [Spirochaetaceae bacterium]